MGLPVSTAAPKRPNRTGFWRKSALIWARMPRTCGERRRRRADPTSCHGRAASDAADGADVGTPPHASDVRRATATTCGHHLMPRMCASSDVPDVRTPPDAIRTCGERRGRRADTTCHGRAASDSADVPTCLHNIMVCHGRAASDAPDVRTPPHATDLRRATAPTCGHHIMPRTCGERCGGRADVRTPPNLTDVRRATAPTCGHHLMPRTCGERRGRCVDATVILAQNCKPSKV